ncbi:hypothetical protein T190115A13A_110021 [Tenacibaculum sp. 190524A02b]|uniref:Uncharacterized protein n=1 Tax=Tenacibaculum vairaonense TaxID=3137860 RepID=A0ABM9PH01_9FLAO
MTYFDTCKDVIRIHNKVFNQLIGKSIDSYFVQWRLDKNEWNEDTPIIALINGKQYEFTAYQLSYSFTIDKFKLTNKLNWYGAGDEMPLKWKKNAFENINSILHKPITKIYGLEYGYKSNFHLVGFEFEFDNSKNCLHISNGLDCNTIKTPQNYNRC